MKLLFIYGCMLYALCQCQPQQAIPNDKLLSPTELCKVLIEIHTLEARILERNYNLVDSSQIAYQRAEKEVFKKLKIDYTQYKNSYAHYLREKPIVLEKVYAIVIDSLQNRAQKAKKVIEKGGKKDSLQKVNILPAAPKTFLDKQKNMRRNLKKMPEKQ